MNITDTANIMVIILSTAGEMTASLPYTLVKAHHEPLLWQATDGTLYPASCLKARADAGDKEALKGLGIVVARRMMKKKKKDTTDYGLCLQVGPIP